MTIEKRLFVLALMGVLVASPLVTLAHDGEHEDQDEHTNIRGKVEGFFNHNFGTSPMRLLGDKENHGVHADGNVSARIDGRIDNLNALIDRIEGSDKLSDEQKDRMVSGIKAQITLLESIKARIEAGDTKADVKTDLKAALKAKFHAMPKAAVTAAGERILSIVEKMETLATRLDTRIDEAAASGKNVDASVAAHTSLEAHIADAKTEAQAAIDLMAKVSLDDDSAIDQNRQLLVEAKSHITDAHTELKAAREDVGTILKDLDINLSAEIK